MGLEYELKYRATPEILQAVGRDFPGEYAVKQMRTAYYDTPGAELSARHWTLRCRRENDVYVCTLKLPADSGARGEWETRCEDIARAVPVLAAESGCDELEALTRQGLVNTCGAEFVRRCRVLTVGKTTLELALDQGILSGGGKTLDFAELELELLEGSREDVARLGKLLEASYGLDPEKKSKFARAKALREE
ncbi:MAG: CYTH domain-containing protein [Oscillospiraceae bacterium]|nr:CYTH domain-containing protein [Oscillospiraceae bacterium]